MFGKNLLKLLAFVIVALLGWTVYERAQWPQDFTLLEAPFLKFGKVDNSYIILTSSELFAEAVVHHNQQKLRYPEDIAVADDGTIYSGLEDGSLVKIHPSGQIVKLMQNHQTGMICGIILTSDNSLLYYVTEHKGLVQFDLKTLKATYILQKFEGKKMPALNGVAIDEQNQVIYITDCSTFDLKFAGKDLLLKRKSGRIISYDLKTSEAKVVIDNLAYPNGIVYDKKSKAIIFSELTHHLISKLKVNQDHPVKQTLVDNLFGYPDNMKMNEKGQILVGFPAVRDQSIQHLNQNPELRKNLLYLPDKLLEFVAGKVAGGIKINSQTGAIIDIIFGEPDKISFVTTILEKNGKYYFSSLKNPTVVVANAKRYKGQKENSAEF